MIGSQDVLKSVGQRPEALGRVEERIIGQRGCRVERQYLAGGGQAVNGFQGGVSVQFHPSYQFPPLCRFGTGQGDAYELLRRSDG